MDRHTDTIHSLPWFCLSCTRVLEVATWQLSKYRPLSSSALRRQQLRVVAEPWSMDLVNHDMMLPRKNRPTADSRPSSVAIKVPGIGDHNYGDL